MSNVYGRKVKEPKVTARDHVQLRRDRANKQADGMIQKFLMVHFQTLSSYFISDLHQAWADFGEAKGIVSV